MVLHRAMVQDVEEAAAVAGRARGEILAMLMPTALRGYGGGGGGFGDGGVARGENGEGRQAERGRGPRQPYRGGGRRGGYNDGQAGNEFGRPRRAYERHSGTGRGYGMKREGVGRGNWGTATDEGLEQLRLSLFSLQYVV